MRKRLLSAILCSVLVLLMSMYASAAEEGNVGADDVIEVTDENEQSMIQAAASVTVTCRCAKGHAHTFSVTSDNYIKYGQKSVRVRNLQALLVRNGFSVGSSGTDGHFGAATKSAVIGVQKKYGLSQDGIVGLNTARKMNQKLTRTGLACPN